MNATQIEVLGQCRYNSLWCSLSLGRAMKEWPADIERPHTRPRLLRSPEISAAHLVNLPGGDENCLQAEPGLIDVGGQVTL
jgi:hypothetical protein